MKFEQVQRRNGRHAASSNQLDIFGQSAILAIILFIAFLFWKIEFWSAVPLAILLGLTIQPFLAASFSRQVDILAPNIFIALYFCVDFGLRAVYLLTSDEARPLGYNLYTDYLAAALWCSILGYVAFHVGYYSKTPRAFRNLIPKTLLEWPTSFPSWPLSLVAVSCIASSVYLFSIGAQTVGNQNDIEFLSNPPPGLPVLLDGLRNVIWLTAFISIVTPHRLFKRSSAWPFIALSLLILFGKIASLGGKQILFDYLIAGLIAFHYLKRSLKIWQLLCIGIPTVLFAFSVINAYRFIVVGQMAGAPKDLADVGSRLSSASDYFSSRRSSGEESGLDQMLNRQNGIDSMAAVIKYTPNLVPYELGRKYLQIPEQLLIPRQIWQNKPVINEDYDFEQSYLGYPPRANGFTAVHLMPDLFMNFSYFGVAAGMLIVGFATRLFFTFCSPWKSAGGVLLYATIMPEIAHHMEATLVQLSRLLIRELVLLAIFCLFIGIRRGKIGMARPFSTNQAGISKGRPRDPSGLTKPQASLR